MSIILFSHFPKLLPHVYATVWCTMLMLSMLAGIYVRSQTKTHTFTFMTSLHNTNTSKNTNFRLLCDPPRASAVTTLKSIPIHLYSSTLDQPHRPPFDPPVRWPHSQRLHRHLHHQRCRIVSADDDGWKKVFFRLQLTIYFHTNIYIYIHMYDLTACDRYTTISTPTLSFHILGGSAVDPGEFPHMVSS